MPQIIVKCTHCDFTDGLEVCSLQDAIRIVEEHEKTCIYNPKNILYNSNNNYDSTFVFTRMSSQCLDFCGEDEACEKLSERYSENNKYPRRVGCSIAICPILKR